MSGRGHGNTVAAPPASDPTPTSDIDAPAALQTPSTPGAAAAAAAKPPTATAAEKVDPAKLKSEMLVRQAHATARAKEYQEARLEYAEALGDMKEAIRKHLQANTWPDAMVGLFAASYQQEVIEGSLQPKSQWSVFNILIDGKDIDSPSTTIINAQCQHA